MTNDSLRRVMRSIALGLPFVAPILAAPFNVGGCYPIGYQCPTTLHTTIVAYAPPEGGAGGELDCRAICGEGVSSCGLLPDGQVECFHEVVECPSAGRRPAGALALSSASAHDDDVTRWLREACAMEAASVPAFDALARELEALGAPRALVGAAQRAAQDELRHTHQMAALAARRGGDTTVNVRVTATPPRSLPELAAHNAAEGCVREAFAAIEAAAQAREAHDEDVRVTLTSIARDEARHALLSLAIDSWARARLSADENGRVDAARDEAITSLRAYVGERVCPEGLGLLDRERALAAVEMLAAA